VPSRIHTPLLTLGIVLLSCLAGPRAAVAGPKIDTLTLTNGDKITVEIKELTHGRLTVKTDALGTVNVHWADVVSMVSPRFFEVEAASGARYYGSLAAGAPRTVVIVGLGTSDSLPLLDLVRLAPIGAGFWSRLDGGISVGFNFAQASQQTQWTLNANAEYRRPRYLAEASISSQLTALQGAESQTRNVAGLGARRFIGAHTFGLAFGQIQQDESLGLNARTVIGAALGRFLLQRRQSSISAFGGAAYTRERFTGEPTNAVGELLAGSEWDWFSPSESDTDLTSSVLTFYPLSGPARVRIEFNAALRGKLHKDFNWSLNTYDSFDSSPPPEQKRNDFGVSISLGWTF
jgi:hypothetical protein